MNLADVRFGDRIKLYAYVRFGKQLTYMVVDVQPTYVIARAGKIKRKLDARDIKNFYLVRRLGEVAGQYPMQPSEVPAP